MTCSSPPSWLVRARRAGGGTLDRQGALAVAGSHTGAGEEPPDGRDTPANALAVSRLCTPGREDGRWTGQRALVVVCLRSPGRGVGAGQGSTSRLLPVGARLGGGLGATQRPLA